MTSLISSGFIASRSRAYFGCCSSNLLTCISVTALSWVVVSSVPVRNLTTSLLPPRLPPQPAAPTSATPVSPTPPNLRKSFRLTALGICPLCSREPDSHRCCHAPTCIERMLLVTGSPARFSGALISRRSGVRAQPQRDVGWLHRLPHDPDEVVP